jgi:hypothetical protein
LPWSPPFAVESNAFSCRREGKYMKGAKEP